MRFRIGFIVFAFAQTDPILIASFGFIISDIWFWAFDWFSHNEAYRSLWLCDIRMGLSHRLHTHQWEVGLRCYLKRVMSCVRNASS